MMRCENEEGQARESSSMTLGPSFTSHGEKAGNAGLFPADKTLAGNLLEIQTAETQTVEDIHFT